MTLMPEHHVHLTVHCSECGDDGLVLKPSTKMVAGVCAITGEDLEQQLEDAGWAFAEEDGFTRLLCPDCCELVLEILIEEE